MFFKSKASEFNTILLKAHKQNGDQDYKQVLESLSRAEKLLDKKEKQSYELARIYDLRRFAQYELGLIDAAIETCQQAIKHLDKPLMDYESADNVIRATLRSAHNTLAWVLCERAKSTSDCLTALSHINTCLKTISPIEDKSQLSQFFETKALVLLRLHELDTDSTSVPTELLSHLTMMTKTNHEALTQNASLRAFCQTPEFKAFFEEDPENKFKIALEGETAGQALVRYQSALNYYEQINSEVLEYFAIEESKPLTEDQIKQHEITSGATLPGGLREFALTTGVFKIGPFETKLEVLPNWDQESLPSPGLVDFIDYCWGGRPEFEAAYRQQQLQHVNQNFIAFAVRYIDDNCHEYLFFDREGNFDSIALDQDSFEYFQDSFDSLLTSTKVPTPQSFCQVLSQQISGIIEKIQQQINDE